MASFNVTHTRARARILQKPFADYMSRTDPRASFTSTFDGQQIGEEINHLPRLRPSYQRLWHFVEDVSRSWHLLRQLPLFVIDAAAPPPSLPTRAPSWARTYL